MGHCALSRWNLLLPLRGEAVVRVLVQLRPDDVVRGANGDSSRERLVGGAP